MRGRVAAVMAWAAVAGLAVWIYVAHRAWLSASLAWSAGASPYLAPTLLVVLGAVRGFTLVPSTALVLIALPFVPPTPLLLATVTGIAVSSTTIYWFAGALGLDRAIERRHGPMLSRVRALLTRYEVPVIVAWSFFPLVPTDAICYVCGVTRVPFGPFLLSVTAGESAICALYIYGGHGLLRWLGVA